MLFTLFQKIEEGAFPHSFYEVRIAVTSKLDKDMLRN